MFRVLRGLIWLIAAGALAAGGVALFARVTPGPIGPFPGGALSGDRVHDPVDDWAFAADQWSVSLEIDPASPRSITTWILVHEGNAYIPAAFAETKSWPKRVVSDGRIVVGIDGSLYPRRAVRVTDATLSATLGRLTEQKYEVDGGGPETWYFRLDPPAH